MSRRAVLTAEQARELRERYRLHAENTPRKLGAEFAEAQHLGAGRANH